MTASQFQSLRNLGLIADDTPVRTIIWKFANGQEWEEVFIPETYSTIERQESEFRAALSLATFITPFDPAATVSAKNWVAPPALQTQPWYSQLKDNRKHFTC